MNELLRFWKFHGLKNAAVTENIWKIQLYFKAAEKSFWMQLASFCVNHRFVEDQFIWFQLLLERIETNWLGTLSCLQKSTYTALEVITAPFLKLMKTDHL